MSVSSHPCDTCQRQTNSDPCEHCGFAAVRSPDPTQFYSAEDADGHVVIFSDDCDLYVCSMNPDHPRSEQNARLITGVHDLIDACKLLMMSPDLNVDELDPISEYAVDRVRTMLGHIERR